MADLSLYCKIFKSLFTICGVGVMKDTVPICNFTSHIYHEESPHVMAQQIFLSCNPRNLAEICADTLGIKCCINTQTRDVRL